MRLNNKKQLVISTPMGLLIIIIAIAVFCVGRDPGFGVIEKARKASEMNNLGQIAKSFIEYEVDGPSSPRTFVAQPGETVHNAAFILARDVQLNDASVWFVKSDEKLAGVTLPKTVMLGDTTNGTINPAFGKLPLSVVVVANISTNVSPTSTPVAWTRGLTSDGTWTPDSPWKGQGGHIAYLDGHVEWCEKFSSVKYGTQIPTNNIREALPPGVIILSAEPRHPAK